MTWVQVEYTLIETCLELYLLQDQLDDEALFPSKIGVPFPSNFLNIAKTILKRLFRVYAHIYHQHFKVQSLFDSNKGGVGWLWGLGI